MNTQDTIAAVCTGVGGAISIIRISGKHALQIGNAVWESAKKLSRENARKLLFGYLRDNSFSDGACGEPVLAVYMPGPNSYTGEDVVEIHCHGGIVNTRMVLTSVINCGARHAEPGEFTYRAFVNGKKDLTQAEAVADLISAHTTTAIHLAEHQIAGKLSAKITHIRNKIIEILAEIESRLDFPEEDLEWEDHDRLVKRINSIICEIEKLKASHKEGYILRHGIRVVIAGKPNAGKSSLMNLLLGFDRAIVTHLPGTTRDTLEEYANLRNIPVRLIDTAGIRDAEDIIEKTGVERSLNSIKHAQIIFWVMDASVRDLESEVKTLESHMSDDKDNILAIWNKTDITDRSEFPATPCVSVRISVKTEEGIDELLNIFEKMVWDSPHDREPEIAVNARHAEHLKNALENLKDLAEPFEEEEWEIVSLYLRRAAEELGKITGENIQDDILETIFSKFCIGK